MACNFDFLETIEKDTIERQKTFASIETLNKTLSNKNDLTLLVNIRSMNKNFDKIIVYYAPREEKTYTVHSSCELTPEPSARVSIHTSCGLANFTPMERILFFLTSRPKMPYFRFGAGRE